MKLPESPAALAAAEWSEILPYYDTLATTPLDDSSVERWLADWSRLEEVLGEAGALAMIAYTGDTADPEKEKAYLRFSSDIFPKADEQQVRLAKRLLGLGWTREDLETTLRGFRTDAEIFREENVPLNARLEELAAAYQKITGGLTVDWDGERKTIPQLQPYMQSQDRAERERAFRLGAGAYLAQRDALATIFDEMYELRQRVARNAGFEEFQAYMFKAKHRFDYTPEDCSRFHDAVAEAVVPVARHLIEERQRRLGLSEIRPWDLQVDPDDHPALRPFATAEEFVGGARRVFRALDDELGDWFDLMAKESLLDLESREGKAPGGYCTKLSHRKRPFIFMNAVGVADDVSTLVHESGHCFHTFAAADHPFVWQRGTGSEAAELASMSMELLAAPFLARPTGFYSDADLRRARVEHLEDVVFSLVHIATIDAFQRWIYTSGQGHDRDARDAAWLEILRRYDPGVNWEGLEAERTARWYRQLHIFEVPFYYIEYGIAQLGALQVWRASLENRAEAVSRYKKALALGGTRPLPEIYGAAGAKLAFDAGTMRELLGLVEETIAQNRTVLAS